VNAKRRDSSPLENNVHTLFRSISEVQVEFVLPSCLHYQTLTAFTYPWLAILEMDDAPEMGQFMPPRKGASGLLHSGLFAGFVGLFFAAHA
jgi:hypothetical protein